MLPRLLNVACFLSAALTVNMVFIINAAAGEKTEVKKIPNDVNYMLEDMYGMDKKQWPDNIYHQDLNNDGMGDWVAQNKSCATQKNCPADIFICIPDGKGKCSEYCYKEVKTLIDVKQQLKKLKCESTC